MKLKANEKGLQKRRKRGRIRVDRQHGKKADQVVKLIGEGKTNGAAAQKLGIGVASVYRVMRSSVGPSKD